ncbi:hypothetical protein ACIBAG_22050 [Streptomyces sp. NPDC051243]
MINGEPRVRAEVADRVREVIAELGQALSFGSGRL